MKTESELLDENMGLVVHIVKRFNPPNETEQEEYTQVGMIGLMKSIRKHDPTISKLSTFAWRSITNEILHYIKSKKKHKHVQNFAHASEDRHVERQHSINYLQSDYKEHNNGEDIESLLPQSLSEAERNIISLKLDGHSMKEIISLLPNLKECQVQKLFKTAIQKIKKANE